MSRHSYVDPQKKKEYGIDMAAQGRSEDAINFEPRHKVETYTQARKLRKWIAENPGSLREEMPPELAGYLTFLCHKKLVTWKGMHNRVYFVIPK